MLLQLDLVLPGEHLVLLLELGEEQLLLELLLLLEEHQLLLELLLPEGRVHHWCASRQRGHPQLCPQVHGASSSSAASSAAAASTSAPCRFPRSSTCNSGIKMLLLFFDMQAEKQMVAKGAESSFRH